MNDVDNQDRGSQETVDGFSDTDNESTTGIPDPGNEQKIKPLSPDEYAKAQKEAREEEE